MEITNQFALRGSILKQSKLLTKCCFYCSPADRQPPPIRAKLKQIKGFMTKRVQNKSSVPAHIIIVPVLSVQFDGECFISNYVAPRNFPISPKRSLDSSKQPKKSQCRIQADLAIDMIYDTLYPKSAQRG